MRAVGRWVAVGGAAGGALRRGRGLRCHGSHGGDASASRRDPGARHAQLPTGAAAARQRARARAAPAGTRGSREAGWPVVLRAGRLRVGCGGLRILEPAVDLPLALALASALKDRPVPQTLASFGELGLTGQVRPVAQAAPPVREATRLGMTRVMGASSLRVESLSGVRSGRRFGIGPCSKFWDAPLPWRPRHFGATDVRSVLPRRACRGRIYPTGREQTGVLGDRSAHEGDASGGAQEGCPRHTPAGGPRHDPRGRYGGAGRHRR